VTDHKNFDGIILIDKPAGMSSFGVVARVRRVLSEQAGKKIKVGHTGTLDPFATGLMIIVVGDYCKHAQEFSKLDKTYEATARLGQTSSTGDPEGEITDVSGRIPTQEEIERALQKFRGTITQTPPIYSAIKINGQRAYKLAREGRVIEMPARTISINHLEVQSYTYPILKLFCDVSSGTYIRTLVEDIGRVVEAGAYTIHLSRLSVGSYSLANACSLESFNEACIHKE